MKWMIKEREEIIPEEEIKIWAEKQVGKVKGLREKCLGEKWESFCRERSKRNEKKIALKQYIERRILMDQGAVESCRALILDRYICWGVVEHLSNAKKPRWIEQLSSRQKLSRWIENLTRSYREAIKKNSRNIRWIENAIRSVEKKQSKGLDR